MHEELLAVYYGLLLSGFTILIVRRRKLGSIFLIFFPLYFFTIAAQGYFDIVYRLTDTRENWVYHVNQFIGSFLLHTYYYTTLGKKSNKGVVAGGFICFSIYFSYRFLYHFENMNVLSFSDFSVEGLLICIYAVLHLLELYQSDTVVIPGQNLHFWLTIGNLVFFACLVPLMGLLEYLVTHNRPLFDKVVYINHILNLFLYSVYIKAFLCNLETKK